MEVPVVVLQLLQAVKGHKAVLALLLDAQEVVTPEMFSEVLGSIEVRVGAMAHAQLTCEVMVMHVLPKLLPTEEMDVAEPTEGVGCGHMGLQLLLTGKHWQLQREGASSVQADRA